MPQPAELRSLGLARSDPEDVGIGRRNRDRADAESRFLVEDRLERDSVIGGLEDAACGQADVEERGIAWIERDFGDASAHDGWSNGPRFQVLEKDFGERRSDWRLRRNFRLDLWGRGLRRGRLLRAKGDYGESGDDRDGEERKTNR